MIWQALLGIFIGIIFLAFSLVLKISMGTSSDDYPILDFSSVMLAGLGLAILSISSLAFVGGVVDFLFSVVNSLFS